MVLKHESNGDYYVNLCLSQLTNELYLKNGGKKGISYEIKPSISFILNHENYVNLCLS